MTGAVFGDLNLSPQYFVILVCHFSWQGQYLVIWAYFFQGRLCTTCCFPYRMLASASGRAADRRDRGSFMVFAVTLDLHSLIVFCILRVAPCSGTACHDFCTFLLSHLIPLCLLCFPLRGASAHWRLTDV